MPSPAIFWLPVRLTAQLSFLFDVVISQEEWIFVRSVLTSQSLVMIMWTPHSLNSLFVVILTLARCRPFLVLTRLSTLEGLMTWDWSDFVSSCHSLAQMSYLGTGVTFAVCASLFSRSVLSLPLAGTFVRARYLDFHRTWCSLFFILFGFPPIREFIAIPDQFRLYHLGILWWAVLYTSQELTSLN